MGAFVIVPMVTIGKFIIAIGTSYWWSTSTLADPNPNANPNPNHNPNANRHHNPNANPNR